MVGRGHDPELDLGHALRHTEEEPEVAVRVRPDRDDAAPRDAVRRQRARVHAEGHELDPRLAAVRGDPRADVVGLRLAVRHDRAQAPSAEA